MPESKPPYPPIFRRRMVEPVRIGRPLGNGGFGTYAVQAAFRAGTAAGLANASTGASPRVRAGRRAAPGPERIPG